MAEEADAPDRLLSASAEYGNLTRGFFRLSMWQLADGVDEPVVWRTNDEAMPEKYAHPYADLVTPTSAPAVTTAAGATTGSGKVGVSSSDDSSSFAYWYVPRSSPTIRNPSHAHACRSHLD